MGTIAGGARPKLDERGSIRTSDDLLMTLGLLSVELASSVDRELFLDTVAFRILRYSSFSWLSVLKREGLVGDLARRGELKGEDSADEVVSLSCVPCLCRPKPFGESREVKVFKLKEEGEMEPGETVAEQDLEQVLDLLLGITKGSPHELGSLWNKDSFLLVWGLSKSVQKP